MTLTLPLAPTSIFHLSLGSLEWSLSPLLWKHTVIASCNRHYTVANCGWSCWTWQSEVQEALKPATAAKIVCTPEKWIRCVFSSALALFQQRSLCLHCWLFIVWLHNHLTQYSLVCKEHLFFFFSLSDLLVITKSFFEIWLDLSPFGARQESDWFRGSSFAVELWEKMCL